MLVSVCVHTMWVSGTHRGQKKVSDALKAVTQQVAVCCHIGAGNLNWSSARAVSVLNHQDISPAPFTGLS